MAPIRYFRSNDRRRRLKLNLNRLALLEGCLLKFTNSPFREGKFYVNSRLKRNSIGHSERVRVGQWKRNWNSTETCLQDLRRITRAGPHFFRKHFVACKWFCNFIAIIIIYTSLPVLCNLYAFITVAVNRNFRQLRRESSYLRIITRIISSCYQEFSSRIRLLWL